MHFSFLKKYRVLFVSLGAVSIFATTVFAAGSGPFTPHQTLDPDCAYNDVSGTCYVTSPSGGGVTIGDAVGGGTANQVLYTDAGGNVGSDANFIRTAALFNLSTVPQSNTLAHIYMGNDVLGAQAVFGHNIFGMQVTYETAFGNNGLIAGDLSNVGGPDNATIVGLLNLGGNSVNTNYDYNSGTEEGDIRSSVDDTHGHIDFGMDTIDGFNINGVDNVSQGFTVNDDNHTKRFQVFNDGSVRINDAYTFPLSDGTSGDVLTTNGSGTLSWVPASGGGSLSGCTSPGSPSGNVSFGQEALNDQCPGPEYSNTAIGTSALKNLAPSPGGADSSRNTAVGEAALSTIQLGTSNTAIGYQAGVGFGSGDHGDNNVFIGSDLNASMGGGGSTFGVNNNVAIGQGVGISGRNNVIIGQNTAVGTDAIGAIAIGANLSSISSGEIKIGSLIDGFQSNNALTLGNYGTGTALDMRTGGFTFAMGTNTVGVLNTADIAFGTNAGRSTNLGSTQSIYIGQGAGDGAGISYHSIFIGYQAGLADTVNNSVPGSTSILIGENTRTGANSNSIALGNGAINTSSNQFLVGSSTSPINQFVMIGTGGTSCAIDANGTSCSSDERLKTNITDLPATALDTISNLKTVTFNWINGADTNQHIGFIAQNVQQFLPQLVSTASNGYLQVNYAGITPVLAEAIRELNVKVTSMSDLLASGNSFAQTLIAWFGNAQNHITRIFTGEICLTDDGLQTECINRQELHDLKQLLNNQGQNTPSVPNDAPTIPPDDQTPPSETPTPSDETVTPPAETAPDVSSDPVPTDAPSAPTPADAGSSSSE